MTTPNQMSTLRRKAVDQLAIGGLILFWGTLLVLKQIGLIDRSISTLPIIMAAFGLLLVIGGINRLNRSRHGIRANEEAA